MTSNQAGKLVSITGMPFFGSDQHPKLKFLRRILAMRNFKKLSALVVAIALVLTSIVPAFAYTPVNADKAEILRQLEIYQGISTDSFVPALDQDLTRGQGALLLARLFNKEADIEKMTDAEVEEVLKGFADGSKVPAYVKKAVAYFVDNKVINGSLNNGELTIDEAGSLYAEQFAALILRQMGYQDSHYTKAIEELAAVEGVAGLDSYTSIAGSEIKRDHAVGIMYGSLTGKYEGETATVISKIVEAKPALREVAEKHGLIEAEVKALAVESVTALNAKQLEIKFNVAVDKDSAEDESNYEVKDKGSATISLGADSAVLADSKTVIITLDGAAGDKLTNSTDAKVTVKKEIKSATGETLGTDYVNSSVKVADGVIPTVEKVEAVGETTLKITFTEPVYNGGTSMTIANQNIAVKSGTYTYYVQSATADAAKKTITATVGTKLIEGPITVTVNAAGVEADGAIQDYAGYKVFKGETTFNYVKDTTVPTVTIKEAKQESITLAFSKPVKGTDINLFHSVKNVEAYKSDAASTSGYVDEITFNFTNKIPSGNIKLFLVNSTVSGYELVDGFGIKVPDQTLNAEIVVDITGPVVSSTKLNTNASFEIVFNEAIDEDEAVKLTNYSFKSTANGKDVSFSVSYDKSTDAKKVTLLASLADSTDYQVVVKAMKDVAGNAMSNEAAFNFTVGDHTNPTVSDKYAVNDDGKIYITFSEPMNQTQLSDKTNYAVSVDNSGSYEALGENDTVTVTSNKSVVIKLDGKTVNKPMVKMAGITDLAGKKLGSDIDFVYVVDNILPEEVVVSSAELIAKNKIKLIFNKELSTFDNREFKFVKAGSSNEFATDLKIQSVESMTKNSDGNTEVILVTDYEVGTNAKIGSDNIDVLTNTTTANTKSVSGTVLKANTAKTVSDKLAAEVVKYNHDSSSSTDDVAKVLISDYSAAPVNGKVAEGTTATISIHFTESMSLASMSTLTFSVGGYSVIGIDLNADSSIVELTVKATADNTTATPTVTQNYNIMDQASNVFTSGSVWQTR